MKKIILFCLLSFGFMAVNAQYTTNADTFNITYSAGLAEFSTEIHFTNTSTSSLNTTWTFTDFTMVPAGWSFGFCDNNSCYPVTATSNLSKTFTLDQDSSFNLSVHISPYGQSANIVVPISLNGGGLRKTIYLKININATSINDKALTNIKIYPNPSTNYLKIDNLNLDADAVTIYNSVGNKVYSGKISTSSEIDLSNFANGKFIVTLSKEDKKVLTKSIFVAH